MINDIITSQRDNLLGDAYATVGYYDYVEGAGKHGFTLSGGNYMTVDYPGARTTRP